MNPDPEEKKKNTDWKGKKQDGKKLLKFWQARRGHLACVASAF